LFFLRNRATLLSEDIDLNPSTLDALADNPIFFLPKGFIQSDFFSGPEFLFENEAWAPEPQIRLFNKNGHN
jgi:hypothetical protein